MLLVTRVVYRLKVRGDEHLPTEGAAILVCNHVSFVDAVILGVAQPAPDGLPDGPPHLQDTGDRLVLPGGQGHPDRAAKGRP